MRIVWCYGRLALLLALPSAGLALCFAAHTIRLYSRELTKRRRERLRLLRCKEMRPLVITSLWPA